MVHRELHASGSEEVAAEERLRAAAALVDGRHERTSAGRRLRPPPPQVVQGGRHRVHQALRRGRSLQARLPQMQRRSREDVLTPDSPVRGLMTHSNTGSAVTGQQQEFGLLGQAAGVGMILQCNVQYLLCQLQTARGNYCEGDADTALVAPLLCLRWGQLLNQPPGRLQRLQKPPASNPRHRKKQTGREARVR